MTDVRVYCGGCLVVGAARRTQTRPDAAARLAHDPAFAGWPLVVLTDEPARAARSDMNFLWTTFTRFEPAADIHAADRRIVRNHIAYTGPVVIDARMKPGIRRSWSARDESRPPLSRALEGVLSSRPVEMGDSDRAHLD